MKKSGMTLDPEISDIWKNAAGHKMLVLEKKGHLDTTTYMVAVKTSFDNGVEIMFTAHRADFVEFIACNCIQYFFED